MSDVRTSNIYCPHCNVEVGIAHNGLCTNSGCGKKLSARVFRVRLPPKAEPVRMVVVNGRDTMHKRVIPGERWQSQSMYGNIRF